MEDDKKVNVNGGGIGFCGLLTVLFIGLKLTGFITWSWLWVLAPLWISAAVTIVVIIVLLIVIAVMSKD